MRAWLNLILFVSALSFAQVNYGTPPEGLIPAALEGIPLDLKVMHFPKVNHPVKIDETEDGQRVCGYATIHTTDQLLNP